jgi:hypothetical protein
LEAFQLLVGQLNIDIIAQGEACIIFATVIKIGLQHGEDSII